MDHVVEIDQRLVPLVLLVRPVHLQQVFEQPEVLPLLVRQLSAPFFFSRYSSSVSPA